MAGEEVDTVGTDACRASMTGGGAATDDKVAADTATLEVSVLPRDIVITVKPRGAPPSHQGIAIGAGGIATAAHQADVEVRVLGGGQHTIELRLEGGKGEDTKYGRRRFGLGKVPAKLEVGGTPFVAGVSEPITVETDAQGVATGTLTSSNRLENCRILASTTLPDESKLSAFVDVPFEAGKLLVEFDKESLSPRGVVGVEVTLTHHKQPMKDHELVVWASKVVVDGRTIAFDIRRPRKLNRYVLISTWREKAWRRSPRMEWTDSEGKTKAQIRNVSRGRIEEATVSAQDFSLVAISAEE